MMERLMITVLLVLCVFLSLVSSLGYTSYTLCPRLAAPGNGRVFVTGRTYGSAAFYSCFLGYVLEPAGFRTRRCLYSGIWSGEAPSCRTTLPAVLCPSLPSPANGDVEIDRRTPGGTASYTCDTGFLIDPASSNLRTCQENGEWTGVDPACKSIQVDCGDPGTPVNGRRRLTTTIEGDIVEYFCSTGFDLEGDQQRKCQSNGLWTGQLPICRQIIDCGQLSNPDNGVVSVGDTLAGSTAEYSCNPGFILRGAQVRVCQANGMWSGQAPTCQRQVVNCGQLQNPENGFVQVSSTTEGSTAIYTCSQGFQLVGNRQRTCQNNGQWSGQQPFCQRRTVDCGNLINPVNGVVELTGTTEGSSATYRCLTGFTLFGTSQRICQNNGFWSGVAPVCQRSQVATCSPLAAPVNGQITTTGLIIGSSAVYSCNVGFFLSGGSRVRICQSNGQWSGSIPRCFRLFPPAPPGVFPPVPVPPGPVPPGPGPSPPGVLPIPPGPFPPGVLPIPPGPFPPGVLPIPPGPFPPGVLPIPPGPFPPGVFPPVPIPPGFVPPVPGPFPPGSVPLPIPGLPSCILPDPPVNGQVFATADIRSSVVTYVCDTDFELVNGNEVRVCQRDGTYSGRAPQCIPSDEPSTPLPPCTPPDPPVNGQVFVTEDLRNFVAFYVCDTGFRPVEGNIVRLCQSNGAYGSRAPRCIRRRAFPPIFPGRPFRPRPFRPRPPSRPRLPTDLPPPVGGICPHVPPPENGLVKVIGFNVGNTATYSCFPGYRLKGASVRTCTEEGDWSQSEPRCVPYRSRRY